MSQSQPSPLVTVIIPSYNTGATIGRTIDSILSTGYTNLQLIVVDDGSKDDSLEVIKRYAAQNDWIEFHTHPGGRNKGIAATRNLAISHARGEYVAFVDADDTFLPNRFDVCIPKMEADNSINVIYEPYRLVHVSGSRSEDMKAGQTESLINECSDEELFMRVLRGSGMPHTTSVTIRRTALLDTELFPPLKYCLEKPLWLKLYCRGGVRPGATEPVACYYLHGNSTCAKHEDTRAFRFEDVIAYLNVYRWMSQRNIGGKMQEAVKSLMLGKYLHYTSYARSLRGRFFSDIVCAPFAVLRVSPTAGLNPKFWWATARMVMGVTNKAHV